LTLAVAVSLAVLAAPSFVPSPPPSRQGPAAVGVPQLLGAASWLGASAAHADDAQEELAQAAASIPQDADGYVPLTPPVIEEPNAIKISEFLTEASGGISNGKVDYGLNAFGDVFAELSDRASKSIEEGDIPWEAIGAVFLILVVLANSGALLGPIFEEALSGTSEEEEMAERQRAAAAAAAAAAKRRQASQDVDLNLPPRPSEELKEESGGR